MLPLNTGRFMKICFKCGKEKHLSEFYKHKQMADGHLGKCKSCTKIDSKLRSEKPENIESVRECKRLWARGEKGRETNRKYLSTGKGRVISNSAKKKYTNQNGKKKSAKNAVNNAVKYGSIVKPSTCDNCKKESNIIHGHHCDYDKPLTVDWLCPSCHSEWHRNNEPING